jgi:hypothetical protein
LCRFRVASVNVFALPRFDFCTSDISSSTNKFAHGQTLSRMRSLSGRMNIGRVNIEFFPGWKKIKQRRISFVLGYLRMILWKISTAASIKHRILATFNIKKNQFWQPLIYLIQNIVTIYRLAQWQSKNDLIRSGFLTAK